MFQYRRFFPDKRTGWRVVNVFGTSKAQIFDAVSEACVSTNVVIGQESLSPFQRRIQRYEYLLDSIKPFTINEVQSSCLHYHEPKIPKGVRLLEDLDCIPFDKDVKLHGGFSLSERLDNTSPLFEGFSFKRGDFGFTFYIDKNSESHFETMRKALLKEYRIGDLYAIITSDNSLFPSFNLISEEFAVKVCELDLSGFRRKKQPVCVSL